MNSTNKMINKFLTSIKKQSYSKSSDIIRFIYTTDEHKSMLHIVYSTIFGENGTIIRAIIPNTEMDEDFQIQTKELWNINLKSNTENTIDQLRETKTATELKSLSEKEKTHFVLLNAECYRNRQSLPEDFMKTVTRKYYNGSRPEWIEFNGDEYFFITNNYKMTYRQSCHGMNVYGIMNGRIIRIMNYFSSLKISVDAIISGKYLDMEVQAIDMRNYEKTKQYKYSKTGETITEITIPSNSLYEINNLTPYIEIQTKEDKLICKTKTDTPQREIKIPIFKIPKTKLFKLRMLNVFYYLKIEEPEVTIRLKARHNTEFVIEVSSGKTTIETVALPDDRTEIAIELYKRGKIQQVPAFSDQELFLKQCAEVTGTGTEPYNIVKNDFKRVFHGYMNMFAETHTAEEIITEMANILEKYLGYCSLWDMMINFGTTEQMTNKILKVFPEYKQLTEEYKYGNIIIKADDFIKYIKGNTVNCEYRTYCNISYPSSKDQYKNDHATTTIEITWDAAIDKDKKLIIKDLSSVKQEHFDTNGTQYRELGPETPIEIMQIAVNLDVLKSITITNPNTVVTDMLRNIDWRI